MASVDVGIPCYQYGRYLRDCVTSVLKQDVDDLRVLIIDNASTDDSLEVARQLAAEDARVEVLAHERNLGPHASYNEAVDWAEGDYFLLLDADDLLAPGCLARAVAVMEANPEVSFTCGTEGFLLPDATVHVFERNYHKAGWSITSGEDYIRRLCSTSTNTVAASSVVRRTSAQKKAGHYRAELPYSDDVEMWMRLATFGHVARTPAVQAIRRIHASQHGASYQADILRDFREREAAFDSFFAHEGAAMDDSEELLARAKRSLAEHAYWAGLSRLCRGQLAPSRELMRYSMAREPSVLAFPPIGWLIRANRVSVRVCEVIRDSVLHLLGRSEEKWHGHVLKPLDFDHDQLPRIGADGVGAP